MNAETITTLTARIQSLESAVDELQRDTDREALAFSDQQYLARCFDLLRMELTAVRSYISELR